MVRNNTTLPSRIFKSTPFIHCQQICAIGVYKGVFRIAENKNSSYFHGVDRKRLIQVLTKVSARDHLTIQTIRNHFHFHSFRVNFSVGTFRFFSLTLVRFI